MGFLIISHFGFDGQQDILNGCSVFPFVQQVQFLDFTIALIHAWDIHLVDEADLWRLFGIIGSTGNFERINPSIEYGLGYYAIRTLKGPRMVPFHSVIVISSAAIKIIDTCIEAVTDSTVSDCFLTFLEFFQ